MFFLHAFGTNSILARQAISPLFRLETYLLPTGRGNGDGWMERLLCTCPGDVILSNRVFLYGR